MQKVLRSFTHRHTNHRAELKKENRSFNLFDSHDNEQYPNVYSFRNRYVEDHLRNGQQMSNIIIILNDEPIGRYAEYKSDNGSLRLLYERVTGEDTSVSLVYIKNEDIPQFCLMDEQAKIDERTSEGSMKDEQAKITDEVIKQFKNLTLENRKKLLIELLTFTLNTSE